MVSERVPQTQHRNGVLGRLHLHGVLMTMLMLQPQQRQVTNVMMQSVVTQDDGYRNG